MDRRDAYHRRIWRLCFLLGGGDHRAAGAIARRILWTRTDLLTLDPAHLDRLCVLAARQWADAAAAAASKPRRPAKPLASSAAPPASPAPDAPARAPLTLLHTAARMPRQSLEAWVLTRIDQLDPIAVARAMDCSKTAAQRHLDRADELMRNPLANFAAVAPDPLTAIRTDLDRLDPGPALRELHAQRRAHRRRRTALLLFLTILLLTAAAVTTLNLTR